MAFSGYKLWNIYSEYSTGDNLYNDYANRFIVQAVAEDLPEHEEDTSFTIDFDALLAANQDIVAWIYSEDTTINYPIVQSSNNDYYLRRLLDGSYNIAGSIFMDYRNYYDFTDLNIIIYGHNLRDGTMFASLKEYKKQDYYDSHPIIHLFTPKDDYIIELIGGFQTDIYSNIYSFPESIEELEILYDEIINLSTFKSDASPLREGDRLLTLSTCSDGGDKSRYVLIGKIIEKNIYRSQKAIPMKD